MDNGIEEAQARKEDILGRSRAANDDEGAEYAAMKGSFQSGLITFSIVSTLVMIFLIVFDQRIGVFAITALSSCFTAGQQFSIWRFTGKKFSLASCVTFTTGATLSVAIIVSKVGQEQGWW